MRLARLALIKARKARKLTVAEMAGEMDISTSFYYKIESGLRNPTIDLAKKIADFLGSDVDALFFAQELDETSNKDHAAALDPTGTEEGR